MKKLHFTLPENSQCCNCHLGNWTNDNLFTYEFHKDGSKLIWINKDILFWTADEKNDAHGNHIEQIDCKHKIMMNLVLPNAIPSFYWSRDENALNRFMEANEALSYSQRSQNTIFLGSIKDSYQGSFRDSNVWKKYVDEFDCKTGGEKSYKYDQEGYYKALARTRYGLSLRGGGPKCWRDIEYLALGCVLIATKGVDVKNFHNPLEENVHYIFIEEPSDIEKKINAISEEKWNEMSKACQDWYRKNCHYKGSIKVLEEIVENISQKDAVW